MTILPLSLPCFPLPLQCASHTKQRIRVFSECSIQSRPYSEDHLNSGSPPTSSDDGSNFLLVGHEGHIQLCHHGDDGYDGNDHGSILFLNHMSNIMFYVQLSLCCNLYAYAYTPFAKTHQI